MARPVAALLGLLLASAAVSADLRTIEIDRDGRRYKVITETYIGAPPAAVYTILADYEGFHRISKVFTESRYLERDASGNGVVYTRAQGCVLFFCTEIERVENLTVKPGREIVARAIPERSDVDYSEARWQFESEGEGTRLIYGLEFEPSFWIPPVIGPMIIRSKLRSRGIDAAERIEELAKAEPAASVSS